MTREELRAEREKLLSQPPTPKKGEGDFVYGVKRNLEDAYRVGKDLAMLMPNTVRAAYEIFSDTEGLKMLLSQSNTGEILGKAMMDHAKDIKSAVVDDFSERYSEPQYHLPSILLDVLTVLDLGGGLALKGGQLAGGMSKVARGARVAGTADKLVELGEAMKSMPMKMYDASEGAILRAFGKNPESLRWASSVTRENQGWGRYESARQKEWLNRALAKATPEDMRILDGVVRGTLPVADLQKSRSAALAYKMLDDWTVKVRQESLGGRALMTEQEFHAAKIKKLADARGIDEAAAKALYESGQVRPVYVPAVKQTPDGFTLTDALAQPTSIKGGKAGFLERFVGGREYSKDPRVYIARSIDQFYQTEAQLRFMDRAFQSKYARATKPGEVGLSELVPSQGVFKRYFKDAGDARSKAVALKEASAEAREALLGQAKEARSAFNRATGIAIEDKTLLQWIQRDFASLGGEPKFWLKVYDRLVGLWKRSNTAWNPAWPFGNAVSNAMVMTIAGSKWGAARQAIAEARMPRYMRAKGGWGEELGGKRGLFKWEEGVSDVVGQIDDAGRAGVITRELERKLKGTTLSFTAAEDSVRRAVFETAMSPDELSRVEVALQRLGEEAARRIPKVGKAWKLEEKLKVARDEALSNEAAYINRAGRPTFGQHTPELQKLFNEARRAEFRYERVRQLREAMQADVRQRFVDMGALEKTLPELTRKAEMMRDATRRANMFFGEYLGLSPFERDVFKRIVPFYPWVKAIGLLAFRMPFLAPAKTFLWHRYSAALQSMMGDHELPEWTDGFAPVGVRENGDTVWLKFAWFPFGSWRTTEVAGVPIPQGAAIHQQNPAIALGLKLIGYQGEFYASAIKNQERIVSVADGTVYRARPDGRFEQTIAQPPMTTALASMFAPVQLANQLWSEYDVRKGPTYNPDGSVRFPIELWQRLGRAVGVTSMVRNRENIIAMEQLRVRQALEGYKKKLRTASPDEREYIMGVLSDKWGHVTKRSVKAQ